MLQRTPPRRRTPRPRTRIRRGSALRARRYAIMTTAAAVLLFPFYWALVSSLKPRAEQAKFPPTFWPSHLEWGNYTRAWTAQPFTLYFFNSVEVTVLAVIGVVLSSSLVAYGFARFQFRGKNALFALLLATMIIPWDVLVVPLYMQYSWLGWVNTYLPLIVPSYLGIPYYVFLLTQFLRGIPRDFEEAGLLDGANHFQVYWKIFMPMMRPQLVLTACLHTIVVWNDFLGPLVFLNDPNRFTLPIGLSFFKSSHLIDQTSMLAVSVVMVIVPLVVFFVGQRHILGNDAQSGVKG